MYIYIYFQMMASTVVRISEIHKWRFKFSNGFYGRLN